MSRGWPCNGRFSDRQRALYQCAYNTSEYMFKTIRPGIPMADIDEMCHRYCCEELKKLGLLSSYDEIGKYMWHGGAHYVVTENGCENLSAAIPRTVDEIEALMAQG